MRTAGLLLLLVALCPEPGYAQSNGYQVTVQAAARLRLAAGAPTAEPLRPFAGSEFVVARKFSSRAPGATLMIIGGAAIVTGILVGGSGGTILIVGGVGVGAYGVYLYTQ